MRNLFRRLRAWRSAHYERHHGYPRWTGGPYDRARARRVPVIWE